MNTRTMSCAAAVAVVAVLLGAPFAHAQSAAQLTEEGRQALTSRQFDRALEILDRAIEADGSGPLPHYYRGVALANMGRERDALGSFLTAGDLNPGWGEAHRMATIAALNTGNLTVAWEQAIKAHQAGADVSASVNRLLALEKAPGDLDQQLGAARIFVAGVNTEKLEARQDNPFGASVDAGGGGAGGAGGIPDPFSTSASRATNVGGTQASQSQSDFNSLLMQTRKSLAGSRHFGVVANQELAQWLLVFEIDEIRGDGVQKPVRGYLKLIDPRTGEEAYRRVLELTNIASLGDLNRDIERIVGLMEEWLIDRSG